MRTPPGVNLSRRNLAGNHSTTTRAGVLMLFGLLDFSSADVKPVAAHTVALLGIYRTPQIEGVGGTRALAHSI